MFQAAKVRGSRRNCRLVFCLSTVLSSGIAIPAMAQNASATVPPVNQAVDGNGVDLLTGQAGYSLATIAAGDPALGGVNFSITNGYESTVGFIKVSGTSVTVTVGLSSDAFTQSGSTFTPTKKNGSTLTLSGGIYTYTAGDGTIYRFWSVGTVGGSRYPSSILLQDVTKPNSIKYTYYYKFNTVSVTGGVGSTTVVRLKTVTSSVGYQIQIYYRNENPNTTMDLDNAMTYSQVKVANTLGDAACVGVNNCSPSAPAPTLNFSYSGSTITVTDALGRVVNFTGPSGGHTTYTFTNGKVSSVISQGVTSTYAYADAGSQRTVTIATGGTSKQVVLDLAIGKILSSTNELSKTTGFAYDAYGRLLTVTAPELNKVGFTYDDRGNALTTTSIAKSGGATITTSASYPCTVTAACNSPASTTDAQGQTTQYSYDPTHGGLTSVTKPAVNGVSPQTRYSYSRLDGSTGSPSSAGIWMLTGISECRTTASCVGTVDEAKTTITYGPNLKMMSVVKAAGDGSLSATVTFGYDIYGHVTAVDGPLAGAADTVVYRYDAMGERIGTITPDPDGGGSRKYSAQRLAYNNDGQVTVAEVGTVDSTSDADWANFSSFQQVTATYDGNGRKIKDALTAGGTTYAVVQYSYDSLGRLLCSAQRMNAAVWGSQVADCTPNTAGSAGPDRIAMNSYDAASRITKVQAAYGTSVQADEATITYTSNGKKQTVVDANGNVTTYGYDGFDRLSTSTYPGGSYEQLTYDVNSNVTQRRLRDGNTITFTYDNLGRMASRTPNGENAVNFSYNLLGQVTNVQRPGDGINLAYTYDGLGRLSSETQPFGSVSYLYDVAGNRTRLTWGDGNYVSYDYDLTGNVTAIRENGATSGVGVLASYSYDTLGRRSSVTYGNGTTRTYAYDSVSRLAGLKLDLGGAAYDNLIGAVGGTGTAIGYNPASQITSLVRSNDAYAWTGAVNANRAYTTNGLNQYTAAGGVAFDYDGRGNLTSSGSSSYGYDKLNEMTSGPSATMRYDGAGRLIEYSAPASTRFVYDGTAILAEVSGSSGATLRRYVPGPGTDEPVVWYEGSGLTDRRFLQADERGSIVAVTDNSGNVLGTNAYDEFGIPRANNIGRFQYTGQAWFPEVGLAYYKARWYSPSLGRFMQTDPIGYNDGMNWYNYVGGDPVNSTDPSGNLVQLVTTQACGSAINTLQGNSVYTNGQNIVTGEKTDYQYSCQVITFSVDAQEVNNANGNYNSSGGSGNTSSVKPQSACSQMGTAMSPLQYANLGRQASLQNGAGSATNSAGNSSNLLPIGRLIGSLFNFRRNGPLDAEAQGGTKAYGNYTFGIYTRAAGFSLTEALDGANLFGWLFSKYDFNTNPADSYATHIPKVNADAIRAGYADGATASSCGRH